jgi:endogenous inhibitor of DNA gyrase (YacG/DUF329 family)
MKQNIVDWTCPLCGDVIRIYASQAETRRFCSRRCYGISQRSTTEEKKDYDDSISWFREHRRYVCPYQENVGCDVRHCSTCGWNPEVKAKRDEEIRRKYGNHNV